MACKTEKRSSKEA